MYKQYVPNINPGDNLIIGTGDSFTQGVGAYPIEVWEQYNGKINCLDPELISEMLPYMYEGSWVNQLCKNHLINYKPINLGVMGTGNRSAAKELFLNNLSNINKAGDVIVIYLMSGMERFDFVNRELSETNHFYTMWPNPGDKTSTNKKLWECYARDIWSERFVVIETIINMVDVQNFCKANNYKLIVASAFDYCLNKEYFERILLDDQKSLLNLVDWKNFFYPKDCRTFMELLLKLEGDKHQSSFMGGFYKKYSRKKFPSKYITTCVHPSIEGHKVIAEEFYKVIIERKLAVNNEH